ncbi:MAG TPA: hypothetical protein VGL95_16965, partial [Acetobacteraceae bacterium]
MPINGQAAYDPTLSVGRVVHVVHLDYRANVDDLVGLNRWFLYRNLLVFGAGVIEHLLFDWTPGDGLVHRLTWSVRM